MATSLQPVSDAPRTHCTTRVAGLGLIREAVDAVRRRAPGRSRPSCRGTRPAARRPPGPRMRKCVSRHSRSLRASPLPLVGDADAAGEGDRLVDDHHLAVRAVVDVPGAEPVQRTEPAHVHAGPSIVVDELRGPSGARPTRRAGRRTRTPACARSARRSRELGADLAVPVDEGQEVDRVLARRRSRRASPGRSRRRCAGRRCWLPSVAGTPMTPSSVRRELVDRGRSSASARRRSRRHASRRPGEWLRWSGSECSTFSSSCGVRCTGPHGFELRGDRRAEEHGDRREQRPEQQGDDAGQRSVRVAERGARRGRTGRARA